MNSSDDRIGLMDRIDRACVQFEIAWGADRKPSILDYLAEFDASDRRDVFRHLLAIERELRRADGTELPLQAYRQRFPEFDREIEDVVETAPITEPRSGPRDPTLPLRQIGPYEIIGRLGEGGFGTVYKAVQSTPFRRTVALKVLRTDMDSEVVLQRFEAERQALALMDHANIAQALDAGTTEYGRSYFVMEFVDGCSITEYCDRECLSTRDRLVLFVDVCRGVQHAHMKGVIHRDLKPSNILVASQDGKPVAKIIDFGVAKATEEKLTDLTIVTMEGLMIGTPAYMSPEQAEGSLDVDSRADVFALGAVLYELLTGSQPLDRKVLLRDGPAGIPNAIRDIEPPRPSSRLYSPAAASHAAHRGTDASGLRRTIEGDLDWITLKALEKDRRRRYQTARDFAADIDRYLNNEAVLAAPPNTLYRLRKLVRRRKKTVAAVAAILLTLIVGMIGTGVGLWKSIRANEALARAVRAKDQALLDKEDALQQETEQRTLAEANEDRARAAEAAAEQRADELERITQFESGRLRDLDAMAMGVRLRDALLEAVSDDARPTLEVSLADVNFTGLALRSLRENLFDRTLDAIDERFHDQPRVQSRLLLSMSDTLTKLGLLEQASEPQARGLAILRALHGQDDPETLITIGNLGARLCQQGRLSEAEAYLRESLEGLRRVLGDDHPKTLNAIGNLGTLLGAQGDLKGAETLGREALEGQRRTLGADDPQTLLGTCALAALLSNQDKLEEAEGLYRDALDRQRRTLGEEHPHTLVTLGALGALRARRGYPAEGEAYCKEALEGQRRTLGDDHPHTLVTIAAIGELLSESSRLTDAEPYNREALEGRRRVLGNQHPETLTSVSIVGFQLHRQGKSAEAWPYYEEALLGRRRVLGDEHPATLDSINGAASLLADLGRLGEARQYYVEALEGRRRVLGPDHPKTLATLTNLGVLYFRERNSEEAERLIREGLEGRRRVLGDDDPSTLASIINLGNLLSAQGKYDEAAPFVSETVATRRRLLGDDHPDTLAAINDLASLSVRRGNLSEADRLYQEAIDGCRRALGGAHIQTLATLRRFGVLRAKEGRNAEAVSLYREAFEGQRSTLGDDHADTVRSSDSLKGALVKQVEVARLAGDHDDDHGDNHGDNHGDDRDERLALALGELGDHLMRRSELAEAETALVESAEFWIARPLDSTTPRPQVAAAIDRVVALYEARHAADPAAGYDAKAKAWRALSLP